MIRNIGVSGHFLFSIFGLPNPLLPNHVIWISLVTVGISGLAPVAESDEKGL
jgi:hypothetical protein